MIKEGVVNVKYKQLLPLPPWVHFFHLKIVFAIYDSIKNINFFCLPHNLSLSSQFSPGSTLCLGLRPGYESFKKTVGHLGFRLMFHVDPDLFLLLKVIEHFWQILRDSLSLCYSLFQAGKFPTQIQKNIFRVTFPSS